VRKNPGLIIITMLTVVLIGMGLGRISETENDSQVQTVAGVQRSEAVIQTKIEGKKAKLAENLPKPQGPDGNENFRSLMRPHPDGVNTKQLLLEAKKEVESMPVLSGSKDAGLWDWQWLGPGNIGGRVRAILTHPDQPNTLWAGSAGGGIWKTTNGGFSWYPLNDFLPSLAITSLAMDPNDPDTIYAGTGEGFGRLSHLPGAGIFKSEDGGDSWVQLPATANTDARFINDVAHHPVNSGWLIACGVSEAGEGMIWRTTNGGDDWDRTITPDARPMDVKYDPDHPEVVIVGTNNGALRSSNSGADWESISDGSVGKLPANTGRCEIAFGSGTEVVYASCDVDRGDRVPQGEIWRSLDNGITWYQRSDLRHLATQGWYDNVIWVVPGSTQAIIVGGVELFSSIDGGQTLGLMSDWTEYHHGTSAHADIHAIVPSVEYDIDGNHDIFIGNDGGIQVATNGLFTEPNSGWVNLANNLGITQFNHADVTPDGSMILGGSQDNDDLLFTTSGGAQGWFQAETGDGTYCAINPVDQDTMYACYPRLAIQRSIDGGQTYQDSFTGIEDQGQESTALFVSPFALDKVAPRYLYAGGLSIWKSSDYGNHWVEVLGPNASDPRCSAIEIAPNGSRVVWVGYENGYILKTENFGMDWTYVEDFGGPLPNEPVTDIEINPNDPEMALITFGGYYSNRVWLTVDGGDNWTCRSGSGENSLPEVQVNCITFHPGNENWLYVGTDIGMFASEDLGQTWNVTPRYGSSEGPVFTEVSDLIWHSNRSLIAVTYGRGMFQCQPVGEVWVDQATSGYEDGTPFYPFDTIVEGYQRAGNGTKLVIFEGQYVEPGLVMEKRLRIDTRNGTVIIR